jgi:hypothetical protein
MLIPFGNAVNEPDQAVYSLADLGKDLLADCVGTYSDGTLNAWIGDKQGRGTEICIDARIGSPTRHRLFEKARHPRKHGAILVELGAPEEGMVVALLSRWLDSDEALRWLTSVGKEVVQRALLNLGTPSGDGTAILLEIVLPLYLEDSTRSAIESRLQEKLRAHGIGEVTGGGSACAAGAGADITDFFVKVTELGSGVAVIRAVFQESDYGERAVIKQYEPYRVEYPVIQDVALRDSMKQATRVAQENSY